MLNTDGVAKDASIVSTLSQDKTQTKEEALREVYARVRPGDPATDATCRTFFDRQFFDPSRYDFAALFFAIASRIFIWRTRLIIVFMINSAKFGLIRIRCKNRVSPIGISTESL